MTSGKATAAQVQPGTLRCRHALRRRCMFNSNREVTLTSQFHQRSRGLRLRVAVHLHTLWAYALGLRFQHTLWAYAFVTPRTPLTAGMIFTSSGHDVTIRCTYALPVRLRFDLTAPFVDDSFAAGVCSVSFGISPPLPPLLSSSVPPPFLLFCPLLCVARPPLLPPSCLLAPSRPNPHP